MTITLWFYSLCVAHPCAFLEKVLCMMSLCDGCECTLIFINFYSQQSHSQCQCTFVRNELCVAFSDNSSPYMEYIFISSLYGVMCVDVTYAHMLFM